jgi:hypothetical protein
LVTTTLLLGGCSYGYTLKAEAKDGKVTFTPEPTSGRRSQGTGCLSSFTVKTKGGETVWEWGSEKYTPSPCQNLLPVTYGVVPGGLQEATKAKPLRLGVEYVVEAWDGNSYTGSFRLEQGVYAENLPYVSNILSEAAASSSR